MNSETDSTTSSSGDSLSSQLRHEIRRPDWNLRRIADLMLESDVSLVRGERVYDYRAETPMRQSGGIRSKKGVYYKNYLYRGRTWRYVVDDSPTFQLRPTRQRAGAKI